MAYGNLEIDSMAILSSTPRVSVLMSTHNVSPYLQQSIESILGQTFRDFELLIIDDASTDDTWQQLEGFAKREGCIRLFKNPINLGLPSSLNRIVPEARGEYIARMDADDIATPDRFTIQVATLDRADADICASAFVEFPSSRIAVRRGLSEDSEFRASLLFDWSIMHPTVMLKTRLLKEEPYRADMVPAADYDLWVRLSGKANVKNLPDVLLLKRVHEGQISHLHAANKLAASMRVRRLALGGFGIQPTDRELYLQSLIWTADKPSTWEEVIETETWLVRLSGALSAHQEARRHLSRRWYTYCVKCAPYGLKAYRLFKRSSLFERQHHSAATRYALAILCLLRIPFQSKISWALTSLHPSYRRKAAAIRKLPQEMRRLLRP